MQPEASGGAARAGAGAAPAASPAPAPRPMTEAEARAELARLEASLAALGQRKKALERVGVTGLPLRSSIPGPTMFQTKFVFARRASTSPPLTRTPTAPICRRSAYLTGGWAM